MTPIPAEDDEGLLSSDGWLAARAPPNDKERVASAAFPSKWTTCEDDVTQTGRCVYTGQ
jgi:hypothetical protein